MLKVSDVSLLQGHSMYGDWALPGRPYSFLNFPQMLPVLVPNRKPEIVCFDDICSKPGNWFGGNDFEGPRYENADVKFSGLLVKDMPNPCNSVYRMIDGRRRQEKLRRMGVNEGSYFVFEYKEVKPYIVDFILV